MASKAAKKASSSSSGHSQSGVINEREVSSSDRPQQSSPSRLTRLQEKAELQNLNDRLANYIDRVRHLEVENHRLSTQIHSSHETTKHEVISIKNLYEKELSDARKLLDETSKERARLMIEINKLRADSDEANQRYTKKEKDLNTALKKIANLESNVDELKNRVNQAIAEKKRAEDDVKDAQNETDAIAKQLETLRKQLQEETLLRVDLENRLQSLREEITFREQIHETELTESRNITETEITERINENLREQYDQRLQDELAGLREENEAQLKLNRDDMEHKYGTRFTELQNALDQKTEGINQSRAELQNLKSKNETLVSKMTQLESINQSLNSRITDLERLIEQEREWKDNALTAKDDQINQLREEIKNLMGEYHDLIDIKIALDMEIAAYRKLLEGEESRLNLSSTPSTPVISGGSRVVSPRSYTPVGRSKRKRTVLTQEEENIVDIVVNSNAKGDVEINDHDYDGKFVKLFNKGDKEVSLSGWQLLRKAGDLSTQFKFHRSIVIKPNSHVTVWSSDINAVHSPPSDIVMKGQKWFVSDAMNTVLINNNGEEVAVRETSKRLRSTTAQRTSEGYYRSQQQQIDSQSSSERCSIM